MSQLKRPWDSLSTGPSPPGADAAQRRVKWPFKGLVTASEDMDEDDDDEGSSQATRTTNCGATTAASSLTPASFSTPLSSPRTIDTASARPCVPLKCNEEGTTDQRLVCFGVV